MDGNEVYEMIREIANTSDIELIEKFGTCELDDIVLKYSVYELWNIWYPYSE